MGSALGGDHRNSLNSGGKPAFPTPGLLQRLANFTLKAFQRRLNRQLHHLRVRKVGLPPLFREGRWRGSFCSLSPWERVGERA